MMTKNITDISFSVQKLFSSVFFVVQRELNNKTFLINNNISTGICKLPYKALISVINSSVLNDESLY